MQEETYQLTVNDNFDFTLTGSAAGNLDVVNLGEGRFHILQNGRSYQAECHGVDVASKEVHLKINGKSYQVKVADHFDQLVRKMGLSANVVHKITDIKAPMPGLVLSILVEPGQEVQPGDQLLILEAMKMENVIKAAGEGKVKNIQVAKGKAVEKGELLIEME